MKFSTCLILIGFIFYLCGCDMHYPATKNTPAIQPIVNEEHEAKDVSIIKLIANPEKYNGKLVRVIGYLNLEFEGDALYVHADDYERAIDKNGIWVNLSRDSSRLAKKKNCSKNYVLIEATYNSNNNGNMGLFSGSLTKVTRLELWESARAPLKSAHR